MSHIIHLYLLHDPTKPKTTTKNNIRVLKNLNTILNTINKNGFVVDIELVDENDPTVIDDLKFRKLEKFPCAQLAGKVFNGLDKIESLFQYAISKKVKAVKPKTAEEMIRENQMSDICEPGEDCNEEGNYGNMDNKKLAAEMARQQAERQNQHKKYSRTSTIPSAHLKIAAQNGMSIRGDRRNQQFNNNQRRRPQQDNVDNELPYSMRNEETPMMETPPNQLVQMDNIGDGGRLEANALDAFWQNQTVTPGT